MLYPTLNLSRNFNTSKNHQPYFIMYATEVIIKTPLPWCDHCFCSAVKDLRDVSSLVQDIKYSYYQLGKEFGLPFGELESIRTAYHHLIDQAIDQVLLLWLKQCYDVQRHDLPTWRRLVEAVDSPNGGNNPALAIDIANRHLVPGMLCLILPREGSTLATFSIVSNDCYVFESWICLHCVFWMLCELQAIHEWNKL